MLVSIGLGLNVVSLKGGRLASLCSGPLWISDMALMPTRLPWEESGRSPERGSSPLSCHPPHKQGEFIFWKCTKKMQVPGLPINPTEFKSLPAGPEDLHLNKYPQTLILSDRKDNAGFLSSDFRVI